MAARIRALVAKLKVENDSEVVTYALLELTNGIDANVASEIARSGGIVATVDAMQQFPCDALIQCFGCTVSFYII